jgi:glycosyltransferase involved in cell wall biosynthesis
LGFTLLGENDPVDLAAVAEFRRAYGSPELGSVAVIVPSYGERESIGNVLRGIPGDVEGRKVTVLVVIDGPDDGTSAIARALGAYVCVAGTQRGQGAALRLGYRLAVAHGAAFLVSLDADGQYDPAEMARLLAPLFADEADFVSGSRRLGRDETTDRVRSLGVDVLAKLLSALTGARVTDPAFGLRAMTAKVASAVTLQQPQYQASELLLGAALRGFRIAERSATIRQRTAAISRKGGNLVYGFRFVGVILGTWWRDRRLR